MIFNITIRVIYRIMFNEYIYKNQFVTEIDTHANLLNKIKGKKIYTGLYILKIL